MIEAALRNDGAMQEVQTLCGETGLRHGEALWAPIDDVAPVVAEAVELPAALMLPVGPPVLMTRGATPTLLAHGGTQVYDADKARLGRILHRILETLPDLASDRRLAYAEKVLSRNGLKTGMAARLVAILEAPETADLFGPGSEAEVAIGTRLPDGTALTGVIDRLVTRDQEIVILDYKSDASPGLLVAAHPHVRQLASYCYCLQKIYPGRPIKAAVLWTSEARLEWVEPAEIHSALAQISSAFPAAEA